MRCTLTVCVYISTMLHPQDNFRTYSLAEIAAIICGSDEGTDQRWIADRLRGYQEPKLPGYKARRQWRMTQEDLNAAIELLRPHFNHVPAVTSLTRRSQKKLVG